MSLRPKRSEVEKSQHIEKINGLDFSIPVRYSRNDLKFDLPQATFGHLDRTGEVSTFLTC